jgi:hypothetical protein
VSVLPGVVLACGASKHEASRSVPTIPLVDLAGAAAKAGTRLHPIDFVSDEGLRVLTLRFMDTERGEECSFKPSDDGDWHCFPDAELNEPPFQALAKDCRTPVVPACEAYAADYATSSCENSGLRIYALGDPIEGAPRVPPDCAFYLQVPAGEQYRRVGARIPNDAFVRAVVGAATDGNRIGTQQLSAEDGSALLLGFFDHEEDQPCESVSPVPGGPSYCVPSPRSLIFDYFTDAACSEAGRRLADGACGQRPSVGLAPDEQALYRLGRGVGAVPAFFSENGYCSESQAWEGYEVAESVDASAFAQIQASNSGGGRVQLGVSQTTDGSAVVPDPISGDGYLWDSELGLKCSIAVSSDGEYRCLPLLYGNYAPNLFADDQCQLPLAARAGTAMSSAEPAWLVFTSTASGAGCGSPTSTVVYELEAEPYTGQLYIPSEDIDGNPICLEETGAWSTPLYAVSDEVEPTRFVHFVREAE